MSDQSQTEVACSLLFGGGIKRAMVKEGGNRARSGKGLVIILSYKKLYSLPLPATSLMSLMSLMSLRHCPAVPPFSVLHVSSCPSSSTVNRTLASADSTQKAAGSCSVLISTVTGNKPAPESSTVKIEMRQSAQKDDRLYELRSWRKETSRHGQHLIQPINELAHPGYTNLRRLPG